MAKPVFKFKSNSDSLISLAEIKTKYGYTGKFSFVKAYSQEGEHVGYKSFLEFETPLKADGKSVRFLIIYTKDKPTASTLFHERKPHYWVARSAEFEI